jgi:hypothetical protein
MIYVSLNRILKSLFGLTGKDGAVADLRRDPLINREQGALPKVDLAGFRIGMAVVVLDALL